MKNSLTHPILALTKAIIYLGTQGITDFRELRAIFVVNSITIFGLIVTWFFVIFYLVSSKYFLIFTNLLPLILLNSVLYLNYKKKHKYAKIVLLLMGNLSMPLAAYFLGYRSGIHHFYSCFIVVVVILFPDRMNSFKIFLLSLPMILNTVEWHFSDSWFSGAASLPYSFTVYMNYFSILFSSLVNAFVLYSYSLTVDTYHFQVMKQEEDRIESSKLEALGVLSAGVAHEINNPLAIISARSDQLMSLSKLDKLDPTKMIEITANIKKHSDRISKIVSGLRTFSRSNKHETPYPKSLKYILEECMELFPTLISRKIVKLTIEEFQDINIICRPVQIMQVIINLVNNACDEIENLEKPWIKITVSCDPKFATIRVIDSGLGIEPKLAKKIMQPFFTTKAVGKGTGLGLSISKTILESQNGKIFIDEKINNTCFAICLPYEQEKKSKSWDSK